MKSAEVVDSSIIQEVKTPKRTDGQVEGPASEAEVLRNPKHGADTQRQWRGSNEALETRESMTRNSLYSNHTSTSTPD